MAFDMTNSLSNDLQAEAAAPQSDRRLWFQFAAAAIAWHVLCASDMMILWGACVHQEQFGGPSSHPGAFILFFVLWFVLFGLAALAGLMSYRSWRRLSGSSELLRAEGRDRKEFMSLAGLFVSVTLGAGFIWLCLPLFILEMCARTR